MKILKNFIILFSILFISFGFNYSYAKNSSENSNTQESKSLSLKSVEVIWKNKIKLTFDKNILQKDDNDISVKSLWEDWDEILVEEIKVKGKDVELVLEENLESNKDYEVVIFSLSWENGATITSGLDWSIRFNSW